jgi:hypothetical protein
LQNCSGGSGAGPKLRADDEYFQWRGLLFRGVAVRVLFRGVRASEATSLLIPSLAESFLLVVYILIEDKKHG